MINLTALSTFAVELGIRNPRRQFGKGLVGAQLKQEILKHLNIEDSRFSKHREKISAFANGEKHSEKRWDNLCRMLDGKRVLYYLTDRIQEFEPEKLKKMCLMTHKGQLAIHIANLKLIDEELMKTINSFYHGYHVH